MIHLLLTHSKEIHAFTGVTVGASAANGAGVGTYNKDSANGARGAKAAAGARGGISSLLSEEWISMFPHSLAPEDSALSCTAISHSLHGASLFC